MKLEQAMQSTLARAVATYAVPVLIAVIGTLGGTLMTDIRAAVRDQGLQLQQLNGDMRELKTTVKEGVVWRINELERRVSRVEQVQKSS